MLIIFLLCSIYLVYTEFLFNTCYCFLLNVFIINYVFFYYLEYFIYKLFLLFVVIFFIEKELNVMFIYSFCTDNFDFF